MVGYNKKSVFDAFLFGLYLFLNNNLNTRDSFTSEFAFANLVESNSAVNCGMDRVVFANERTWSCNLSRSGLSDQNFASTDFLTAKTLDAQSLTGVIVDVL